MLSLSLLALSCAALTASCDARHMHRFHMHHAHRRQLPSATATSDNVPTTTDLAPAASITAGDAAIENIQEIQNGLSDLPANLLSFVQAVEARLGEMESMLLEMMGSSSTAEQTVSAASATPTNAIESASTPTSLESPTIIFSSTSSSPASYPTESASLPGVIPVVPVQSAWPTTFRTSRVTSTRTRTVTLSQTTSTISPPDTSRGFPIASSVIVSGNWTMPYASSRRSTVSTFQTRTTRNDPNSPAPTSS
ncbi:hypothetical protein CERZMDRAFT_94283 [Cercospora zeae-maydis SCOH1-5]|uniref:Uncharacterized protein n=1 Tax=Cercospora zeae-maydis SCOH1-5 TaxID=717836 RepID=A0A6A6FQZ5_9PEZI|nr:hypothetical protein CERZMDRAFT_94283 [Cercospora zeae-maydis SCOH1-5]